MPQYRLVIAVIALTCMAVGELGLSGMAPRDRKVQPHQSSSSPPTCAKVGANSFLANGDGNVAAGAQTSVVGGYKNLACDDDSVVAAGSLNIISSGNDSAQESFIGAGTANIIGTANSFVGSGSNNSISGNSGAIVGGSSNTLVGSTNSSIGGGSSNSLTLALSSVIGGGQGNSISSYAQLGNDDRVILGGNGNSLVSCVSCASQGEPAWAFIGGGNGNSAIGDEEVVEGGGGNVAKSENATVPGGYHNLASGLESFAAGFGAYALGDGSFVWADFSPGVPHLTATKTSSFLARASGGVTFYSDAAATTGATLPAGSGAWSSASDARLKDDIVPLSARALLARLKRLPVSRWSYDAEPGIRHIGPMSQDFFAAFQTGNDDRSISTVDEGGVSLAAIEAINTRLRLLTQSQSSLSQANPHSTVIKKTINAA